jgi:hypothetical protein
VTIAYFENHCHRIDFPELFPNARKFDPYARTAYDMMVSFEMLVVCMMEKSEVPQKRKEPLIKTYPKPNLAAA